MTRLIVLGVAATLAEVAAAAGVIHTLLRSAMLARGLPSWRLGDTLLTSPVLWLGVATSAGAVNWLLVLAALRGAASGEAAASPGGVAVPALAALLGSAMAWFGLRAVGKLY